MEKDYLSKILRARNTVFTFKDISLIWADTNTERVKKRVYRYVKAGKLYAIRRGLYAKDKNYDKLELATRIFTPSYVSFETVLGQLGIIFQYYSQIFVASYLSRDIVCDNQTYSFRKIKDIVLTNKAGVENKEGVSIATKERALLDTIYVKKIYYFDNLSPLDWEKVFAILPIYNNKMMSGKVKEIYENFSAQGPASTRRRGEAGGSASGGKANQR